MTSLCIYADESCQNAHRYMVLGGICVDKNKLQQVNDILNNIRRQHRLYGEIKWTKVSRSKIGAYIDWIDAFFECADRDLLHFHSLSVDTHQFDHGRFNAGDGEIGFNKLIYQLLIKFGRTYTDHERIECYLDSRVTKKPLEDLKHVLNNGIRSRWGRPYGTFSRVHFNDSKKVELLQLNDLLIGALSSRANGHHEKIGAAPAKCDLSEYILNKANIHNPLADTPRGVMKFTTWNFLLRK